MPILIKIAGYLLAALIVVQLPFFYALYQSHRVARYLSSLPRQEVESPPFVDVKGTIHVHSAAGGHSTGTYPEIIEAAKEAGYRYLFLTEHRREYTRYQRMEDPELILIHGFEEPVTPSGTVLTSSDREVTIFAGSELEGVNTRFDGLEIYNMQENALAKNTPFHWINFLYHQLLYPDLFYFQLWELNPNRLLEWDRLLETRKVTGTAGNDAHQNIGIVLQTTSGKNILSLRVDPYVRSFQFVTNHVFLSPESEVSREAILEALKAGSSYIAFENIADPMGFSFHAREEGQFHPMGARVPRGSELVFQSPTPVRFLLKRAGETIEELEGTYFSLEPDQPGAYRVEAYLVDPPGLLQDKPWILSNPIFLE